MPCCGGKKFCVQHDTHARTKKWQCSSKCDGSGKYLCVCTCVRVRSNECAASHFFRRCCCWLPLVILALWKTLAVLVMFRAVVFWLYSPPCCSCCTSVSVVVVGSAAFDDYGREHYNMITLAHTTWRGYIWCARIIRWSYSMYPKAPWMTSWWMGGKSALKPRAIKIRRLTDKKLKRALDHSPFLSLSSVLVYRLVCVLRMLFRLDWPKSTEIGPMAKCYLNAVIITSETAKLVLQRLTVMWLTGIVILLFLSHCYRWFFAYVEEWRCRDCIVP